MNDFDGLLGIPQRPPPPQYPPQQYPLQTTNDIFSDDSIIDLILSQPCLSSRVMKDDGSGVDDLKLNMMIIILRKGQERNHEEISMSITMHPFLGTTSSSINADENSYAEVYSVIESWLAGTLNVRHNNHNATYNTIENQDFGFTNSNGSDSPYFANMNPSQSRGRLQSTQKTVLPCRFFNTPKVSLNIFTYISSYFKFAFVCILFRAAKMGIIVNSLITE